MTPRYVAIVGPLQRDHETRIQEHENDDVHRQIAGRFAGEFFDDGGSNCGHDHLDDQDGDIREPKGLARNTALEIAEKSYPSHRNSGDAPRHAA
jgi:hypothetical protein